MVNQSMEESLGGGGMKRRGDSFVPTDSAEESGGEEGSPRLGKVRKCSHVKDFVETTSSFQGYYYLLVRLSIHLVFVLIWRSSSNL